jgi:hypothetical protein
MTIKGMTLGALWRRGWWVILLLVASCLVLTVLSQVVGYVLSPLTAHSFEIADFVISVTVGPLLLGLFFELLASDLPRLREAASESGSPSNNRWRGP